MPAALYFYYMKILIIEDEPGIANFIRQGLEEESYEVEVEEDGASGLERALSESFDLLLLDWMLPELSGIELCRQFREENKTTPVIFLSSKDTVKDTVHGLQAGANDYIKKPFHFEELLERIKVHERIQPHVVEILTLGNITMNVSAHLVNKEEKEISLTKKEFDLLEYLIRHKGQVCRRNDIIEQVWDIHFEISTGVIDVYINSLRNKLGLKTEEDYIQTIRGVGYIAKD